VLLDLPEGEVLDGGDIRAFCLHTMLVLVFILQGTTKMNMYPALATSQTTLHCLSWVWNPTAVLQMEVTVLYTTSQMQIQSI